MEGGVISVWSLWCLQHYCKICKKGPPIKPTNRERQGEWGGPDTFKPSNSSITLWISGIKGGEWCLMRQWRREHVLPDMCEGPNCLIPWIQTLTDIRYIIYFCFSLLRLYHLLRPIRSFVPHQKLKKMPKNLLRSWKPESRIRKEFYLFRGVSNHSIT